MSSFSGNMADASFVSDPNLAFTSKGTPKFKRCNLELIEGFKGFGFTINSKMTPKLTIFDVEPGSPAQLAGIKKNDVLVEVNKKNVRRTAFEKVRMMMQEASKKGEVELLVISEEGYRWFKAKKKRFSKANKFTNENNVELYSSTRNLAAVAEQMNNGKKKYTKI